MISDLLKGLTEEQIEKVKGCKNAEEILAIAKAEGVELTEEQLEAVSGGICLFSPPPCPFCHSENTKYVSNHGGEGQPYVIWCDDCYRQSEVKN
jgi:hypothetical protein